MPDEIIVDSCRVMTVRSSALTRFGRAAELHLEPALLLLDVVDRQALGAQLRP